MSTNGIEVEFLILSKTLGCCSILKSEGLRGKCLPATCTFECRLEVGDTVYKHEMGLNQASTSLKVSSRAENPVWSDLARSVLEEIQSATSSRTLNVGYPHVQDGIELPGARFWES